MYYFLANKIYDLGLKGLGLQLSNTRHEQGLMITEWKPVGDLSDKLSKVELVHKNYLPIYIAYFNTKNEMVQKIYYYKYRTISNLNFPTKVVEFNYLPNGDSTVTRTMYSNIKFGLNESNEKFFNFEIPSDAKNIGK
mgnify:CR=1 FL=1